MYLVTNPEMKAILYALVVAGLAARAETDVNVFTSDPLDWADFPSIGINLVSDAETAAHIGDALADQLIDAEDMVYAGASALMTQVVELKVWTTNADQRDRLGQMLKEILFAGRGTNANPGVFVATDGIADVRITGGHDEGISDTSKSFAPHGLFNRTYYVTAVTEITLQERSTEPLMQFLTRNAEYDVDLYGEWDQPNPHLTPALPGPLTT